MLHHANGEAAIAYLVHQNLESVGAADRDYFPVSALFFQLLALKRRGVITEGETNRLQEKFDFLFLTFQGKGDVAECFSMEKDLERIMKMY